MQQNLKTQGQSQNQSEQTHASAYWHPCPPAEPHESTACIAPRSEWSFVPAAVCISLQERPDRMRAAAAQFRRVGLDGIVRFYRPVRDRTPRLARPATRGIWESHRAVAQWALQQGLPSVLVFEDDVVFAADLAVADVRRVAHCARSLPPRWSILFLGHMPLVSFVVHGVPHLRRTVSVCFHAYMMSRRMMHWLAAHPYDTTAWWMFQDVDLVAALRVPECYAVYPMICFQSGAATDNPKPWHLLLPCLLGKYVHRDAMRQRPAGAQQAAPEAARSREAILAIKVAAYRSLEWGALFTLPLLVAVAALVIGALVVAAASRSAGARRTPRALPAVVC